MPESPGQRTLQTSDPARQRRRLACQHAQCHLDAIQQGLGIGTGSAGSMLGKCPAKSRKTGTGTAPSD
jgi:hypothetical protein